MRDVVEHIRAELDIDMDKVLPVKNYCTEVETDINIDRLALVACLELMKCSAEYVHEMSQMDA